MPTNFKGVVDVIVGYIQSGVVPIIIGLALLGFFWGLIQYIQKGGEAKERENAKNLIIWSITGLFIMISFWGLVQILTNSFGVENFSVPQLK